MRRLAALVLATLLPLGLASCGESSSSRSRPSATIQLDFATTTQQPAPQTCSYSAIPSDIISSLQEFEDLELAVITFVERTLDNPDSVFLNPRELSRMGFAATLARTSASSWATYGPSACFDTAKALEQTALTLESLHRAWEALVHALRARDDDALQSAAARIEQLDQDLRQIACDLAASDGIDISALPRC